MEYNTTLIIILLIILALVLTSLGYFIGYTRLESDMFPFRKHEDDSESAVNEDIKLNESEIKFFNSYWN